MPIPVGNIYAFFTEEPDNANCEQVDLYEDFLRNVVEFHFADGLIIGFRY
jgi:hypothetical protein